MADYASQSATIILMFGVVPVWIAAGLADYFCHRATDIERTSGTTESLLHLLQFGIIGVPVTLALFFDINAGFFALAALLVLLHHVVAAIDLTYANPKRHIAPREQMIHSVLEIFPITAFILLSVLHWPQIEALFGHGPEQADFGFHVRLLPTPYIIVILGSAFLLNLVPYFEELWRCIKVRQARNQ